MSKKKPKNPKKVWTEFYLISDNGRFYLPADYAEGRRRHPTRVIMCQMGRAKPFPIMPGETPESARAAQNSALWVESAERFRRRNKRAGLLRWEAIVTPGERAKLIKYLTKLREEGAQNDDK